MLKSRLRLSSCVEPRPNPCSHDSAAAVSSARPSRGERVRAHWRRATHLRVGRDLGEFLVLFDAVPLQRRELSGQVSVVVLDAHVHITRPRRRLWGCEPCLAASAGQPAVGGEGHARSPAVAMPTGRSEPLRACVRRVTRTEKRSMAIFITSKFKTKKSPVHFMNGWREIIVRVPRGPNRPCAAHPLLLDGGPCGRRPTA